MAHRLKVTVLKPYLLFLHHKPSGLSQSPRQRPLTPLTCVKKRIEVEGALVQQAGDLDSRAFCVVLMLILFLCVSISYVKNKGAELNSYLCPLIVKTFDSVVHRISCNVGGKQNPLL